MKRGAFFSSGAMTWAALVASACAGEATNSPGEAREQEEENLPSTGGTGEDAPPFDPCDPVPFEDPEFEAEVARSLQLEGEPIFAERAREVSGLSLNGGRSIAGIECFENLEQLDLWSSHATTLAPLSGLSKLRDLTVTRAPLTHFEDLRGLSLTHLHVENVPLDDVSALSEMTTLERVSFIVTELTDLSALSGLVNLESLAVTQSPLNNIDFVAGLPNLRGLHLDSTEVTDLSPLGPAPTPGGCSSLFSGSGFPDTPEVRATIARLCDEGWSVWASAEVGNDLGSCNSICFAP